MRLDFLGDALDHWKGSLFRRLQRDGILKDFAVDPMWTDPSRWNTGAVHLYANLLHVTPSQILRHESKLLEDRDAYFAEAASLHGGDLFVDPDTGIMAKGDPEHIGVNEIKRLMDNRTRRILCVYQHGSRKKMVARVDELAELVEKDIKGIRFCSYESPSVAMLFMSNDLGRLKHLKDYFNSLLGFQAIGRIRLR